MPKHFHIATIVNDRPAYDAMRRSMAAVGFTDEACRFTVLDNAGGNRHDPYQALRDLPADGDEPCYVLCHQDLRFDERTSLDRLAAAVAELGRADPRWAVAGTAGIGRRGERVLHLDDPSGSYRAAGLPRAVVTLDENVLVVRRSAGVRPSPGLSGFHFDGADVGLSAAAAGRTCHVIDFPVRHLSGGTASPSFFAARDALVRAWRPRLWVGVVGTTVIDLHTSSNFFVRRLIDRPAVRGWVRRRGWGLVFRPGRRPG